MLWLWTQIPIEHHSLVPSILMTCKHWTTLCLNMFNFLFSQHIPLELSLFVTIWTCNLSLLDKLRYIVHCNFCMSSFLWRIQLENSQLSSACDCKSNEQRFMTKILAQEVSRATVLITIFLPNAWMSPCHINCRSKCSIHSLSIFPCVPFVHYWSY